MQGHRTMVKQITPPPFEPGIYQHFRGWKYEAIGVACHESELTWLVVYKPLYPHEGMPDIWVRPYDDFMAQVEVDGEMVPRFRRVDHLPGHQPIQQ